MKNIILALLIVPALAFSQKTMYKKKMDLKPSQMKMKVEANIINQWEEYSKAFEYSDFEKIKSYFTYPVTLSLFDSPMIVDNENDLIRWYKEIRNNVQEGYKYSMLEKSRVIWVSKEICMVDATYSRFNDNYEKLFTGRGIYMYKMVGKAWKMFSMSGVELNKNIK